MHFACAGWRKTAARPSYTAFSWQIPHKPALVTCPCACQNGCRSLGVWHFTWCAFRLRGLAQNGCPWEFFYKVALVTCPCPISMRRSCGDPGEVLSTRSLHALVQLLMKKSCADPGGILFCADPYAQVLWRSRWNPLRGPCVILHRSLPVVPHKAVAEVSKIGNL